MKPTPKEKAKELYVLLDRELIGRKLHDAIIVMCIVCVDEIISSNPTEYNLDGWENDELYWQQVKEELQKM